jgi:hypothetical protein
MPKSYDDITRGDLIDALADAWTVIDCLLRHEDPPNGLGYSEVMTRLRELEDALRTGIDVVKP